MHAKIVDEKFEAGGAAVGARLLRVVAPRGNLHEHADALGPGEFAESVIRKRPLEKSRALAEARTGRLRLRQRTHRTGPFRGAPGRNRLAQHQRVAAILALVERLLRHELLDEVAR